MYLQKSNIIVDKQFNNREFNLYKDFKHLLQFLKSFQNLNTLRAYLIFTGTNELILILLGLVVHYTLWKQSMVLNQWFYKYLE